MVSMGGDSHNDFFRLFPAIFCLDPNVVEEEDNGDAGGVRVGSGDFWSSD